MSEILPDAEPGSQASIEWLMDRCGKVTASRFKDVIDTLNNGKSGAARERYLWEVVIERLTGKPSEHFTSTAMQWGTENEAFARIDYEAKTGAFVIETGFIEHPEIEMCGGSPDGLIGDDGGIEIKCPFNSAVHLGTILNGMPADHMAQVQGLMWITGREWCDFVSFDPRMPDELQMYVQRIERDEDFIYAMGEKIKAFQSDAAALIESLHARAA